MCLGALIWPDFRVDHALTTVNNQKWIFIFFYPFFPFRCCHQAAKTKLIGENIFLKRGVTLAVNYSFLPDTKAKPTKFVNKRATDSQ